MNCLKEKMLNRTNSKIEIGFVNEHTVEYVLVQKLVEIIGNIPHAFLFPYQTREGNTVSREIHRNDNFSMIGIFSRRPKIRLDHKEDIYIKINQEIIDYSNKAYTFGIPFIAGCPIASNFWDLGNNIAWFDLQKMKRECLIKVSSQSLRSNSSEELLTTNKLRDVLLNNKTIFNITNAMDAIKYSVSKMNQYRYSLFGPIYKPFYLLIRK